MTRSAKGLSGGCECGAVRFMLEGPIRPLAVCHCRQCRRFTGTHFAATASAWVDFSFVQGEDQVTWYQSSEWARRGFCALCGSQLFYALEGAEHVSITAGSIDQEEALKPGFQIFCDFKATYADQIDSVPAYGTYPKDKRSQPVWYEPET